MSFEEYKPTFTESPRVFDKGNKKPKDKKLKEKERYMSGDDRTRSPILHADQDYRKSAGLGQQGEGQYRTTPYIEVIEETPSIKGGLTGLNTESAPPLISAASLRRFSIGGKEGGTFPSLESFGVDQGRLTNAARELKDAAWQRAMEVKDTTMQYANRWGSTVQQRWLGGNGLGMSTWETYGRKKKRSMQLYEQAEQKLREARMASPDRAPQLYLEANMLKQKALKRAITAQQIADKMKRKADCQSQRLRQTTPVDEVGGKNKNMTAWELYGCTKCKAGRLSRRADALEQEARRTQDSAHAGELLEEATRLRRKALLKSEEAQAYADGIKRAADDKVTELRQWAMRNENIGGQSYVTPETRF